MDKSTPGQVPKASQRCCAWREDLPVGSGQSNTSRQDANEKLNADKRVVSNQNSRVTAENKNYMTVEESRAQDAPTDVEAKKQCRYAFSVR